MNCSKLIYFIDEFWYYYRYGLAILAIIAFIITVTIFAINDMQKNTEEIKNLRISTQ